MKSFLLLAFVVAAAACDAGPKTKASNNQAPSTAAPPSAPQMKLDTAALGTAAAPTAAAPTGQSFGAGVKLTTATPIETLLADPKAMVGKSVRVEGMVVDVCPKRGCWMDLAGPGPGQKVRFKVTDGEMVFPLDAKGKYAVAEGVVAVNELTLEETKEYVAYQHKEYGAEKTPESVTEPMVIVRLDGTGAMLRDKQ